MHRAPSGSEYGRVKRRRRFFAACCCQQAQKARVAFQIAVAVVVVYSHSASPSLIFAIA
jgi:hypothetical protein